MNIRKIIVLSFLCFTHASSAHNNVVVVPLLGGDNSRSIKNIVVVALENGDFTSPVDAINSITDASSLNRYVVYIAPGQYTIPPDQQLIMKPFVNLVGSGKEVTTLHFSLSRRPPNTQGLSDPTAALVVASIHDSAISNLTIEGERATQHAVGLHVPLAASLTIRNSSIGILVRLGPGTPAGIYLSGKLRVESSNIGSGGFPSGSAYGIYSDGGELHFLNSMLEVSALAHATSSNGIYNAGNSSAEIINSSISFSNSSVPKYGVVNTSNNAKARISGSTILATTRSFVAATGLGSNESFVNNSVLSTEVTGDPKCNFVFTNDGQELDDQCKVPSPP
ncbi:MAG: glycosyl hydrolase family 28-related protein [Pseudomonadota bacterium]